MTHSHTVRVPLALERALHLFTPVGERAWAPGWDPVFPAGEQGDGGALGTVFLTGGDSTWIVIDREPERIRYARVTPDVRAGTVEVRLRPDGPHTLADVTYETTVLDGRPFEPDIAHWEHAIHAALAAS